MTSSFDQGVEPWTYPRIGEVAAAPRDLRQTSRRTRHGEASRPELPTIRAPLETDIRGALEGDPGSTP